jgi:hypothetical protein
VLLAGERRSTGMAGWPSTANTKSAP